MGVFKKMAGHWRVRRSAVIFAPIGALAVIGSAGALVAPAAAAPALAARERAVASVPADRAYPILFDNGDGPGTGQVTDLGPTWDVSLKVKGATLIAVARNGKFAYVSASGGLAVISGVNTAKPKVAATVNTGGAPRGVAVTPNGSYVLVVTNTSRNGVVKEYSGASTGKLRLVSSVNTSPSTAAALAITPDGKYAYTTVTNYGNYYLVTEISGVGTTHLKVAKSIGVAGYPEEVTVSPNGNYVYEVSNMGVYGGIQVFRNAQTTSPVSAASIGGSAPGGIEAVAFSPNGHWGYAPWAVGRQIVIGGAQSSPKQAAVVKLSYDTGTLAFQPGGGYAFAPASNAAYTHGYILVLTGASAGHVKVAATWRLPYIPTELVVSPVK
jgi:6-phosphogluconolactonase (cycloisomerase 2 family)